MKQTGLRERIKSATSTKELADCLSEGYLYKFASDKTRRAWLSTAKRVRKQIEDAI